MYQKTNRLNLNAKVLLHSLLAFSAAELAGAISQLIDGIVVSRCLGDAGMAAFGLASPCYYLVTMFTGVLAMGGQAVTSKAMGTGDRDQVQKAVSTILACAVIFSVVLAAFVLLFPHWICRMFGAPYENADLFHEARQYIFGWGIGIPGVVFFAVLTPFSILNGNRNRLSLAVLVQATVNCAGDVLLVGGLQQGLFGAGLATSLDYYAAVCILLTGFRKKNSAIHLNIRTFDVPILLHAGKLGLPKLTKRLYKCMLPTFTNRMILLYGGSVAMAAISIQNNLIDFLLIIEVGISESLYFVVQVLYSEKDWNGICKTAGTAIRMLLGSVVILSLAVFFLASVITGIYLPVDSPSYLFTQTAIRILAGYVILLSVREYLVFYIAAVQEIRLCNIYTVYTQFFSLLFTLYFLGKFFGEIGILLAYPAAELFSLLFYLIIVFVRARKKNQSLSFVQALLLLPPEEEGVYSFETDVRTLDDAIAVSKQTQAFCLEKGIDPRRSHSAALCTEETVVNILRHGFSTSGNRHCSVRVIIDHGDVTLRYRDDCKYFNICERYKAIQSSDRAANIGIKMVYALAKDVKYIHVLNLNTVILKF